MKRRNSSELRTISIIYLINCKRSDLVIVIYYRILFEKKKNQHMFLILQWFEQCIKSGES